MAGKAIHGDGLKPVILTPGDPAGVGAEISLLAFAAGMRGFILMEDPERLAAIASALDLNIEIKSFCAPEPLAHDHAFLPVLPLQWTERPVAGKGDSRNAEIIIASIRKAAAMAKDGSVVAIVTNPINKAILKDAGFSHPGHTEFLASLAPTRPGGPLMMLAGKSLRVVPATVHIALRDVPAALTTDLIITKGRLLDEALQLYFGCSSPRIAVCGLNPHAGENGQFGDEDQRVIAPAVEAMKDEGIDTFGPLSADTLFHPEARETYDAAIGMYHDQVLIPFKTIDFDGGVNVTLGLDFIRTSPDHGTTFDIAGTGKARPQSLMAAIRMARMMTSWRNPNG